MNKKMSIWSLGVGLAMAVLPAFGFCDDSDDLVFLHYQNLVQPNETGIYEDNGLLYVQVKVPFDRRKERTAKKKAEVVLAANDLLKKWAIDYSAPKRNQADKSPEGVKFAKKVALDYVPDWQFREWSPKFRTREFPHKTDEGYYVFGQAVEKEAVIKCIPESFFKPFADGDWPDALVAAVKRGIAKDGREKVVNRCGAWSALSSIGGIEDVDFKSAEDVVEKYLKTSDLAKTMRESKAKIEGPAEIAVESMLPGTSCAETNITSSVVTNKLNGTVVKKEDEGRLQTEKEIGQMGRSAGTKVNAVTETADEEEVVETVTCKVVTTKKLIRRKSVTRVKGLARFEEIFLSGGTVNEKAVATTKLGENAAKSYFASSPVEEKEKLLMDALRENPFDAALWNYYGKCLASRGDQVGAAICFKASLRLNPDYEFALVNLAEVDHLLGFKSLAIGLATYARGIAKDKWCITHAEAILKK